MTYPSGRVVNWSYDVAGRAATATDGAGGLAFASSVTYDITGGLGTVTFGNGLQEKWTYSQQRGQVQSVSLGTATTPSSKGSWQYSYCVGASSGTECSTNNGNVVSQLINPLAVTQSYTYDGMNRLKKYSESASFYQTYVYDRYGNRALLNGSTMPSWPGAAVVTDDNPSAVESIFSSNKWNQSTVLNGYVTQPKTNTYPSLAYDAEGRVATATTGATSSASYGYDGEGRRVKRTTSAGATYYVYDAFGQLAAEFDPSNGVSGRQYITADALGSTRAVTDASGALVAGQRHDYAPFGWSLLSGQNGRSPTLGYGTDEALSAIPTLFTGKERDAETGLDYFEARYFSGAQGRFTSPDPLLASGRAQDPQSWNRYAYGRNNPLRFVDPTGLDYYDQNGNRIGTDGNTNGDHYVVTDRKQIRAIRNAERRGENTPLAQVSSATALPNEQARQGIDEAVQRSNSPSIELAAPGQEDPVGGFHEEGFSQGPNTQGGSSIFPMAPGGYADPSKDRSVSVDQGTANSQVNGLPTLVVHIHPSGRVGNSGWVQEPSGPDRAAALLGVTNIVVGAGSQTLYLYNNQRTIATFPLGILRTLR